MVEPKRAFERHDLKKVQAEDAKDRYEVRVKVRVGDGEDNAKLAKNLDERDNDAEFCLCAGDTLGCAPAARRSPCGPAQDALLANQPTESLTSGC